MKSAFAVAVLCASASAVTLQDTLQGITYYDTFTATSTDAWETNAEECVNQKITFHSKGCLTWTGSIEG